jgi:hypothetical protein
MTSIQVSVVHLSGEMLWRISSSRISAPPPGIESRPGRDQPLDHTADRHLLELGDVADLLGRQAMDGEREVALHPAEQILVPGQRQLGVEASLQQDLHAAQVDGLLKLLGQDLARQRVALLAGGRAVEVAELAAGHADVRVVDVAIDDVGHVSSGCSARRRASAAAPMSSVAAPCVEADEVLGRQATAGRGVGQQGVERSRRGARVAAPSSIEISVGGIVEPRLRRHLDPHRPLLDVGTVEESQPRPARTLLVQAQALEERARPRQLLRAQAISDVVGQVAFVRGRQPAVGLGPGARDLCAVRQPLRQALPQDRDARRRRGRRDGPPTARRRTAVP